MWFSPQRREHSYSRAARASRIEGGLVAICGSRRSAAHIRFKHLQESHGGSWRTYQKLRFGTIQD
eukprot:6419019-Pyramimonas_sp.AAC.1